MKSFKLTISFRIITSFIILIFFSKVAFPLQIVRAQSVLNLPVPGNMIITTPEFTPAYIKGLTIHPDNPLRFDFIVNTGDTDLNTNPKGLRQEGEKLIKYFLAALTIPVDELWVNLSPHENNRIIPEGLGQTEMGRDLLIQDYLLKQLTASLMYPEDDLGKKFWERVYKKANRLYGTTDIPINTFNKIWILPDKATVWERDGSVFVVEKHLKIMMEEDYLSIQKNEDQKKFKKNNLRSEMEGLTQATSRVVRDVLIPEIEKEVNEGAIFANLRQIYNSMILAAWYKQNLKKTLFNQMYADQNKILGVEVEDKEVKQKIYNQYMQAFKQGVFDYVKEDYDFKMQEMIPKKYFSGGWGGSHPQSSLRRVNIYSSKMVTGKEDFFYIAATERSDKDFAMRTDMQEITDDHRPNTPLSTDEIANKLHAGNLLMTREKVREILLTASKHKNLIPALMLGKIELKKSLLESYPEEEKEKIALEVENLQESPFEGHICRMLHHFRHESEKLFAMALLNSKTPIDLRLMIPREGNTTLAFWTIAPFLFIHLKDRLTLNDETALKLTFASIEQYSKKKHGEIWNDESYYFIDFSVWPHLCGANKFWDNIAVNANILLRQDHIIPLVAYHPHAKALRRSKGAPVINNKEISDATYALANQFALHILANPEYQKKIYDILKEEDSAMATNTEEKIGDENLQTTPHSMQEIASKLNAGNLLMTREKVREILLTASKHKNLIPSLMLGKIELKKSLLESYPEGEKEKIALEVENLQKSLFPGHISRMLHHFRHKNEKFFAKALLNPETPFALGEMIPHEGRTTLAFWTVAPFLFVHLKKRLPLSDKAALKLTFASVEQYSKKKHKKRWSSKAGYFNDVETWPHLYGANTFWNDISVNSIPQRQHIMPLVAYHPNARALRLSKGRPVIDNKEISDATYALANQFALHILANPEYQKKIYDILKEEDSAMATNAEGKIGDENLPPTPHSIQEIANKLNTENLLINPKKGRELLLKANDYKNFIFEIFLEKKYFKESLLASYPKEEKEKIAIEIKNLQESPFKGHISRMLHHFRHKNEKLFAKALLNSEMQFPLGKMIPHEGQTTFAFWTVAPFLFMHFKDRLTLNDKTALKLTFASIEQYSQKKHKKRWSSKADYFNDVETWSHLYGADNFFEKIALNSLSRENHIMPLVAYHPRAKALKLSKGAPVIDNKGISDATYKLANQFALHILANPKYQRKIYDILKEEDSAMATKTDKKEENTSAVSPNVKSKDQALAINPGGIDLNPERMKLQIKRDGQGIPLPASKQTIENIKIDGFIPIIINIVPINIPQLIGMVEKNKLQNEISLEYKNPFFRKEEEMSII